MFLLNLQLIGRVGDKSHIGMKISVGFAKTGDMGHKVGMMGTVIVSKKTAIKLAKNSKCLPVVPIIIINVSDFHRQSNLYEASIRHFR